MIGLESLGEQSGGDWERDIRTMVATVLREHGIGIVAQLTRKIEACAAYSTQIPFQFGGAARVSRPRGHAARSVRLGRGAAAAAGDRAARMVVMRQKGHL